MPECAKRVCRVRFGPLRVRTAWSQGAVLVRCWYGVSRSPTEHVSFAVISELSSEESFQRFLESPSGGVAALGECWSDLWQRGTLNDFLHIIADRGLDRSVLNAVWQAQTRRGRRSIQRRAVMMDSPRMLEWLIRE